LSAAPHVVIVKTGVANLASVVAAFHRLGAMTTLTLDAELVAAADRVMLPGVGAFGAGMAALGGRESGLGAALVSRFSSDRPTMAICLGLQLLAESSDETPGISGLSIFERSHVARFAGADPRTGLPLKVPQLGWNRVTPGPGARLVEPGHAYFANSFRLERAPSGWVAAMSDYGGPFVAALERGPHLACQIHPELSGPWGQALISRWLEGGC
jgi:imidazole glycerol phosphate synthase glutamine amidotransferase subunit